MWFNTTSATWGYIRTSYSLQTVSIACPDAIDDKRNPQDSTESLPPELNEKEEVICDED
jgi:hypothetical protein